MVQAHRLMNISLLLLLIVCHQVAALDIEVAAPGKKEPKPKPIGPPLVLPAQPDTACTLAALKQATDCPNFYRKLYADNEPDETCCTQFAAMFGDNSTMPTRNCWCDKGAWKAEQDWEDISRFNLVEILDLCGYIGIQIPYYMTEKDKETNKTQEVGPCAGYAYPKYKIADEDEEMEEHDPLPTFRQWLTGHARQNSGVLFSLVFAFPSAVGFLFVMWPYLFYATKDVVKFAKSAKRKLK